MSNWDEYYRVRKDHQHSDLVYYALNILKYNPDIKRVIDLGCGAGNDAKYLIGREWDVYAVDINDSALKLLRESISMDSLERLKTYNVAFEDLDKDLLPDSSLVVAFSSLSFCNPLHFNKLWDVIVSKMLKDAVFVGNFFGVNDEWAVNKEMSFFTYGRIRELFEGFHIQFIREIEHQVPTFTSGNKYGHIHSIIASKL